MNKPWTDSWERSSTYWRAAWKNNWLVPMGFATLAVTLWSVVNPAVVPFLFFRIQPINDPIIGFAFEHNLTALTASWGRILISSAVLMALGIGISRRIVGSSLKTRSRVVGSIMAGVLLMVSWGTLAIMGVPIFPGNGHSGLNIGVSSALAIVVLPTVFWWWPWRLGHPGGSVIEFMGWLGTALLEKLLMAWAWLLGIVVAEMLAAGVAWTTFSPLIGMIVLSAVSIGLCGFMWKAAHYYVLGSLDEKRTTPQGDVPALD